MFAGVGGRVPVQVFQRDKMPQYCTGDLKFLIFEITYFDKKSRKFEVKILFKKSIKIIS